jgi:hypothetical protein
MNDLFETLEEKFKNSSLKLKGNLIHLNINLNLKRMFCLESLECEKERLNNEIEYAKDEIDIHIESLKIELNKIGENLKSKLENIKADMTK